MIENELSYSLPSLWGDADRPHTAREWEYGRKAELLELFSSLVYGRTPPGGGVSGVEMLAREEGVLDGLATRTQLRLTLSGPLGSKTANLLLYVPSSATAAAPAPVFVGLNFTGNHATSADPSILVTSGWANDEGWHDTTAERAFQERRWPFRIPLEKGYAVATMHCTELEADFPGLAAGGVRGLFHTEEELAAPAPDMWGTIGAWAWGLSRILDVLMTIPEVDGTAAVVHGHSRLGKTALWAAAQDPRFAAAISNNSGCVGASLFRHASGETIPMITDRFPHWFARNFNAYRENLDALPIDQHHLLALLAPRPVHVASASLDAHADPRGEYLATLYASPAMALYGHHGTLPPALATDGNDLAWEEAVQLPTPQPGARVGGRLSYHMREGIHDVLAEDWVRFVEFAEANVMRR